MGDGTSITVTVQAVVPPIVAVPGVQLMLVVLGLITTVTVLEVAVLGISIGSPGKLAVIVYVPRLVGPK